MDSYTTPSSSSWTSTRAFRDVHQRVQAATPDGEAKLHEREEAWKRLRDTAIKNSKAIGVEPPATLKDEQAAPAGSVNPYDLDAFDSAADLPLAPKACSRPWAKASMARSPLRTLTMSTPTALRKRARRKNPKSRAKTASTIWYVDSCLQQRAEAWQPRRDALQDAELSWARCAPGNRSACESWQCSVSLVCGVLNSPTAFIFYMHVILALPWVERR